MGTAAEIAALVLALSLLCYALVLLRKARRQQGLAARAEQLQVINEIGQDIAATLDVSSIMDHVVRILRDRLGHYDANILLLDPQGTELTWQAGTRIDPALAPAGSLRCSLGTGIIGQAAKLGQPLYASDVLQDPDYVAVPQLPDTRSELAVPIQIGDRLLGVLDVQSTQLDAYTQDDIAVLQALTSQLAISLENARLLEQTQQRVSELTALRQITLQLISTTSLPTVLETIAASALHLIGASDVDIYLYDREKDEFTFGTMLWDTGQRQPAAAAPREDRLIARVAREGQPIVIGDTAQDPLLGDAAALGRGAIASFPLLRGDNPLGVFTIAFRKPHAFTEDELRVLGLLADQAALGLERAQLFEELNRRIHHLSTIMRISSIVTSILNLDEILQSVLHAVGEALHVQAGGIILVEGNLLVCRLGIGEAIACPAVLPDAPASLIAQVIERKKPARIAHAEAEPRGEPDIISTCPERSLLCAPMLVKGAAIGCIKLVNRRDGQPFSQDDEELLTSVTSATSAAIENARLYQASERRLAETSLLCDLTQHTTSTLALEQVLNSIVERLRTVISCRAITIFLLDATGEELTIAAASGLKAEFRERTRIKVGEGVSGVVFKEVRPMYVRDVPREAPNLGSDPAIRSLLVVPLIAKSKVIGTLSVDSTQVDAFSEDHERLLTIVAAQAASSIENAQLYEAERQRAEELERAYRELKELDRMKSQFVQNISHELRTPLTFIKGYADLLAEEAMGKLSEQQKRSVDIIAQKTDAITRLVNDIITLQEIETMPIHKDVASLGDILGMVVDTARATASSRGLELRTQVPSTRMWIMADDDRLIQVFDNLLGNAIKFTASGGAITVSAQDDGDYWRVSVQDTGIGIPTDKLDKIFERFYQVDGSTTRRFGGTGLGLAIAKEIVLNHDGKIWAESSVGQGSTFHVALPKCADPDDAA